MLMDSVAFTGIEHISATKTAMERISMITTSKTTRRLVLIAVAVVLVIGVLSGCDESAETADATVRSLFRIHETMSEEQTRWIIIGETLLVLFLILLIGLLIALFRKYRKMEKQALETSMRERTLMRENEMLDRLSRMKTEFFQNMSHDFKTPLTVISTSVLNAIDILDYEKDEEEIRESLSLAQSEIMRMSRIVEGALKHAALHDNSQGAEPIDLALLLRKVARTYEAFLDRRGNTISIAVPNTLPRVYGNTDTLLNVLANLISNANRFTRNGKIEISADVEKEEQKSDSCYEYVSVSVSDNGVGVNPEDLEKIFNRGKSESGSGLGLHICKTAIETHGGTISVKSEVGKGTKVTFTVPVYEDGAG